MKKLVHFLILFVIAHTGFSQEWQTDFDTAKQLASEKNLPIILVFQGSDWCAPCIKLDRAIWSSQEFITYATDHFILLKADFPKKKKNALLPEQQKKNRILAEAYNSKGYFPWVVKLTKNGEVLGNVSYQKMTPKGYIQLLESF
ncbi:MAG: thioredoxin family protein [Eudoraea sp.]|nr:thioredoxin family protein [Maribacter sp.]NNE01743.1 thioredoxin family protein [Eudoraea sp.]